MTPLTRRVAPLPWNLFVCRFFRQKNVPPCEHMCHTPPPPPFSPVAWGPQFPMHDHLHLITQCKTNSVYGVRVWFLCPKASCLRANCISWCVCRCLYLCQWGLRHLLRHWLQCPTAAQRGVIRMLEGGCAGGLSSLQLRTHLHFKICLLPGCVLCLPQLECSLWKLSVRLRGSIMHSKTDTRAFRHKTYVRWIQNTSRHRHSHAHPMQ